MLITCTYIKEKRCLYFNIKQESFKSVRGSHVDYRLLGNGKLSAVFVPGLMAGPWGWEEHQPVGRGTECRPPPRWSTQTPSSLVLVPGSVWRPPNFGDWSSPQNIIHSVVCGALVESSAISEQKLQKELETLIILPLVPQESPCISQKNLTPLRLSYNLLHKGLLTEAMLLPYVI